MGSASVRLPSGDQLWFVDSGNICTVKYAPHKIVQVVHVTTCSADAASAGETVGPSRSGAVWALTRFTKFGPVETHTNRNPNSMHAIQSDRTQDEMRC